MSIKEKERVKQTYSKMNSGAIFNRICKGNLPKWEAVIVSEIVERRFPTPKEITRN